MMSRVNVVATVAMVGVLAGCPADPGDGPDDASTSAGETGGSTGGEAGCALAEVPCVDAAIQDLSLQDDKVSAAAVDNRQEGADWVSVVDASAGGTMAAPMNPWVYLRF